MLKTKGASLVKQVCRLARGSDTADRADADLLARFIMDRDEAAFEALLRRHGPMVYRLAQRLLHRSQDAEDVFQATFLVLAKQAPRIKRRTALASWLYGVAYRLALKVRMANQRRTARERQAAALDASSADPVADLTLREAQQLVDEELARLPEKHRAPLVLCYLEGLTRDEAALQLKLPGGTFRSRLERARQLISARLARRGLTLSSALLALGVASTDVAALPTMLIASTAEAAKLITASPPAVATVVSTHVSALAQAAVPAVSARIVALAALALILLVVGGVAMNRGPAEAANAAAQAVQPDEPEQQTKPPHVDHHESPLPRGAVMRLGTTRFRHDHPYLYLLATFSPDGAVVATGGNNEIRLWDPVTGKLVREIRDDFGYSEPIFAPDGAWLAGGLAGRGPTPIRLWDPATGRRLLDIPADGQALACAPDGKLLVTAPADGTLSLWETATGRRTTQLRGGHDKQVSHAAFTADGTRLVTLCTARRVCHWDVATGALAKTIEMPVPRRVHSMCFAPDARSLAVSPRDDAPVFLLDTDTGKETVKLQGEFARGGYGLAFSRDGKTLATSLVDLGKWDDLTTVALWDAGTGKLRRHFTMPARAVRRLVFAPDGRTLLTAGGEPTVHLLDAATGKPRHDWPGHEAVISALAFAPDGSALVSGGLDGALRVWDLKAGRHLGVLPGHRWGVSGIAAARHGFNEADGFNVVSAGNDGCVRVQRLDGKLIHRIALGKDPENVVEPDTMVYALGLAPDGKSAATFSQVRNPSQPMYHVWDLATGKPLVSRRDSANVISMRQFSPNLRLVVQQVDGGDGGSEGAAGGFKDNGPGGPAPKSTVLVHDVATGKQVAALSLPQPSGHLGAFARDGRTLLTATFRGERQPDWTYHNALHLWELATGKERLTISFSSPGRVCQIALAPNGRAAATVSDDGAVHIWDLVSGKLALRHAGPALGAPALAYAPDSRSVAVGYADSTILVWDAGPARAPNPTRIALDNQKMDACWAALAGADVRKAHEAMWTLIAAPERAVPFLGKGLASSATAPANQLRALIADLDSSDFQRRTAAAQRLNTLGEHAEAALREALKSPRSAEQQRRIETILAALARHPDLLRHIRAVEILETIGNAEARSVLEILAKRPATTRTRQEAADALQRLTAAAPAR